MSEMPQMTETPIMNISEMSATEKLVMIFSFYRDAELRGARLLFNLIHHLKDAEAQLKMSRHLADETRHAWLWTKRIADLGAAPVMIDDGYQRRLGLRTGVPKDLIDLLALTVVVEERARSRYMQHAELPNVDEETLKVLKAVTEDESWHLAWIERQMREIAREQGKPERADQALERYRTIDREVWATLAADEAQLMKG
ncbi:MAG TPA: ferritin-like domain-containing protein [Candidatus Binataceae bacterium]|nr:ferritin-like domain-containing protein [Candidatus Binataceae bacterium]